MAASFWHEVRREALRYALATAFMTPAAIVYASLLTFGQVGDVPAYLLLGIGVLLGLVGYRMGAPKAVARASVVDFTVTQQMSLVQPVPWMVTTPLIGAVSITLMVCVAHPPRLLGRPSNNIVSGARVMTAQPAPQFVGSVLTRAVA